MTPQKEPDIEQMKRELLAAGWKRTTAHCWKEPGGGYFLGPYGAWKVMKEQQDK
jgi:hypothetical protein